MKAKKDWKLKLKTTRKHRAAVSHPGCLAKVRFDERFLIYRSYDITAMSQVIIPEIEIAKYMNNTNITFE